ncbi:MAG: hypothetical protein GY820_32075 [Gammaproteobacteria bacterium]|nr:hypothetical protein [Gammaproteobacteria bacterium]
MSSGARQFGAVNSVRVNSVPSIRCGVNSVRRQFGAATIRCGVNSVPLNNRSSL